MSVLITSPPCTSYSGPQFREGLINIDQKFKFYLSFFQIFGYAFRGGCECVGVPSIFPETLSRKGRPRRSLLIRLILPENSQGKEKN